LSRTGDGEEPGLGDSRLFTKGMARRKGSARGHRSNLPIAKRFHCAQKKSKKATGLPDMKGFPLAARSGRPRGRFHVEGRVAWHRRSIVWGKAPTPLTLLTVAVGQVASS